MYEIQKIILAKANFIEEMFSLNIREETLRNLNEISWDESLENIVHNQLRQQPINYSKEFIFDLVNKMSNVKKINCDFYKFLWTMEIESSDLNKRFTNLELALEIMDDSIVNSIKADVLGCIISILLKTYPLNIEKLRLYKEKLKDLIEGD